MMRPLAPGVAFRRFPQAARHGTLARPCEPIH